MRRLTRTFVSLTGPAGNIGDALIRRGTLDWALDTSDRLVVYTGEAPDIWLRQLGIPTDTQVLRRKRSVPKWLWLLVTAPSRPVLVFEAGEIPLHRGNVMRELVFLIETVIVRLKRGVIIRPPRGIRGPTNPAAWIHARAARLSQVALWRDSASAALIGGGRIVPDIGFAARSRPGRPWNSRDEVIVSLRGARPFPDDSWVEAVRTFAATEDLKVRTVVQVREDENRARELAEALGGVFDPWGETDAVEQEASLRARYDGARLVISDRMHVLVLAALSGAVPVELVARPTRKITEAFDTIRLPGVSFDAASHDTESMQDLLRDQLARHAEVTERVLEASEQLDVVESEVRATIQSART